MDEKNLSEELVKRFADLAPSEDETKKLLEEIKKNKWTKEETDCFGKAEAFWYILSDIPAIKNRLMLWGFKMSFDEMVEDQQKKVNILIDAHSQIAESIKLKQILKVVLAVGNYLNASNKNGEANGIKLEVLCKLEGTKGLDGGYSLLMYIYELIAEKYPDSENLHDDFTFLPEAAKQDIEALEEEIKKICDEVTEMTKNMGALKKQYADKKDDKKDDVKDQFVGVMDEFVKDADDISKELMTSFKGSIKNLIDLALNYGEKKNVTVEQFFQIWLDFLCAWGKARQAIKKRMAAEKKKQKLLEKKAKLKAKLEKRAAKKELKNRGIVKSKQDVKDHQRRMTLVGNLVRKNIKKKKEKLTHENRLGLKSRHHSIVLQSMKYYCKHCKQNIEDKMQASGEYCHKCWISPEDRETGNLKDKQSQFLSSQKENKECKFQHNGCCVEESRVSNPLLSGIMEIRKSGMGMGHLGNGHNSAYQGSKARNKGGSPINNMSPLKFNGPSSGMLKVARADSGGTLQHLLGSAHRRGKTSNNRNDYEALGHKVTDTHFHQLAQSLQEWRKTEFDPATAPQMPSIGLAKAKVKARNDQLNGTNNKKRKTQFGIGAANFGTGAGTVKTGSAVTDKYNKQLHGNRKHRKKHKNKGGGRNVQFSTEIKSGPSDYMNETKDEQGDTLGPLGTTIDFKANRSTGNSKRNSGAKDIVLNLSPANSGNNNLLHGRHSGNAQGMHKAKGSFFIDNNAKQPVAFQRTSGSFNRHRKGSNSGAPGSPRSMAARRRRSTIEHNVHIETFKLRDEQKEKMDNPDFIRKLRNDFTNFGSFTYDAMNRTVGIVLIAQKMRKTVFIFLESRLGPIDTNNGQISDDDQKLTHTEKVNGGGKGGGRVSIGSKGDQKRFLLTDMQLEVLSSTEFMKQIVQDFTHFGTLNVHEDELVLESYKRSRTIAACQKLERRLGALWTVEEVVQCMNDMRCSQDDCESRAGQLKFLGSMVSEVSSGTRFRKHRKHGKAAHRWVLIDKDRLYWKENTAAQNQKTRSFNLAKIVAIQPGKHTPALKNADNVEDSNCFSIVSKKHVTLDLSGEDESTVYQWIVYLTAYNRHYKQQHHSAQAEQSSSVLPQM
eukprot:45544_1